LRLRKYFLREMDDLPITGGIIIKLGERSTQPRAREFHLERLNGVSSIVYKSYKMIGRQSDARMELNRNFFVKPVRSATESETVLASSFARDYTVFSDLCAKRCFDIDFFEPDFPPAVGPTKLRTITFFSAPDEAIADMWGYLSSLMIDQGVFEPSSEDPDQFVVVNVSKERRSSITPVPVQIVPIPSPPPKMSRVLSTVDADILLSSLPLPPTAEYVDVSNEVSDADENASDQANHML
jgi:hypothetical protein